MDGSGMTVEQLYLYAFITCGILTVLYVLLGDILEGIFDFIPEGIFSPTLLLSFLTFLSCSGYIFERFTSVSSMIGFLISLTIALILSVLLHFFVLVPLSSAEKSLAYHEDDLKGRVGQVILTIPHDGFGEVLISGVGGNIAKPAKSFDEESIASGRDVLVIDVKDGVLYVSPLESLDEL
jgi:membrane-bound ClpP family serine protease